MQHTYRNYCCDYTPPPEPVQLNSFEAIQRLVNMDCKYAGKWAVVLIILAQPEKTWSAVEVDGLLRIVKCVAA